MNKLGRYIAVLILLGSLPTLALPESSPGSTFDSSALDRFKSIRRAPAQEIPSRSERIYFSRVRMGFLVTGSR